MEGYPRQQARTRRFTCGAPRTVSVADDGSRVLFLRSAGGDNPVNALWRLDPATGDEHLVADPDTLLADGGPETDREQARRERAREVGGGITAYDGLPDLSRVCFVLAGQVFLADVDEGRVVELASSGDAFDARLPDGGSLLVARVDEEPVAEWWISAPVDPDAAPRAIRYPAAGTANAVVGLGVVALDGTVVDVDWRRDGAFEYLAGVQWGADGPPLLVVQSRDQRTLVVLEVEVSDGSTSEVYRVEDEAWVELVPGSPCRWDGSLATVEDRDGARRLVVDGEAVTPDGLQVRRMPTFHVVGERDLRAAVLLPTDWSIEEGSPLPVLLDPYGGPHAQRVQRTRGQFLTSQWFADRGFAVVVTDGRGTPGRGPAWERAVRGDLAGPVLDDQVDALHALAEADDRLDLSRVAIRGWSFGGYLAALAVLARPDVFHAAVAGAPVTDWRLYDTHYTERYLGHPDEEPDNYGCTDLCALAGSLGDDVPVRPLLLVHGLADDNVVAAHTLQLSRALLEAGRPHRVLPLSGVTHMTPQEDVAENLLLLQLDFLNEALGR